MFKCIHFDEFGHMHTPVITITINKVINISIISESTPVFPCFIILSGKNTWCEIYPVDRFLSAQHYIVNYTLYRVLYEMKVLESCCVAWSCMIFKGVIFFSAGSFD